MKEYFYSKFNKVEWKWWEPIDTIPVTIRELIISLNNEIKSTIPATKIVFYPHKEYIALILDKANIGVDKHNRTFSLRQFLIVGKKNVNDSAHLVALFDQLIPVSGTSDPSIKLDISALKNTTAYSKNDVKRIFEVLIEGFSIGQKICIVNPNIPKSLPKERIEALTFATFPTFNELLRALRLFPTPVVTTLSFLLNYEDEFIHNDSLDIQLIYCGTKPLVDESYLSFNEPSINQKSLQREQYNIVHLDQYASASTKFGLLFDLVAILRKPTDDLSFITDLLEAEIFYNGLDLKRKVSRFANVVFLYHRKKEEYTGDYDLFVAINRSFYANKITLLKQHLAFVPMDEVIARLDEYDEICVQNELRDEVPYVLRNRFDILTLTELDSLIARLPSPEKSEVVKNVLVNSIQDRITSWEDFVALYDCKTLNPLILSLSKTALLKPFVEQVSHFWKDFDAANFQTFSISHLPAITYLYKLTSKHPDYPRLLLTRFKNDRDGRWLEVANQGAITLPFKLPLENDAGFIERMEILEKVEAKYRNLPLLKELENHLLAYLPRTKFAQQYTKSFNILHRQPVIDRQPDGPDSNEPPSATESKQVKADSAADSMDIRHRFNAKRVELQNRIRSWVTRPVTIQVYKLLMTAFISLVFVLIFWLWVSEPNTTSSQDIPPVAVQPRKPEPIDSVAHLITEVEGFLNRLYFQGDTALSPAAIEARTKFKGMRVSVITPKNRPSRLQITKIDTILNDRWWNRFVKLYRDSVVVVRVIPADSGRTEKVTRLQIEKNLPKPATVQ